MSKIGKLIEDIIEHGEVHAVVEEYDKEIELRNGATSIDRDSGVIEVHGPDHVLIFHVDRIVSWYKPVSLFH